MNKPLLAGNSAKTINKTYLELINEDGYPTTDRYSANPQGKIDYKQLVHTSFQECINMDDEGFFCVDVREDMREILGALLLLIGCTKNPDTKWQASYTHKPSGELVATISKGDNRREDGTAGWLDCQAIVDILKETDK